MKADPLYVPPESLTLTLGVAGVMLAVVVGWVSV